MQYFWILADWQEKVGGREVAADAGEGAGLAVEVVSDVHPCFLSYLVVHRGCGTATLIDKVA